MVETIIKMDELHEIWLNEIARRISKQEFIDIIENSQVIRPDGIGVYTCRLNIYTVDHKYHITAIDRGDDNGYLGCIATVRKPMAGEKHTRGNDLADGPFTYNTWQKIKNDIIAYELVPVMKKEQIHGVIEDTDKNEHS